MIVIVKLKSGRKLRGEILYEHKDMFYFKLLNSNTVAVIKKGLVKNQK